MRFDPPLPIAAVTLWLPPGRETAADAVAAGRIDASAVEEHDYGSVTVSQELAAPELAVQAARSALVTARWDPSTVDLLVHAWTYYQGHDFWSPPHFVAARAGAVRAVPIGVQQMCNGGAAAVEVAASRLLADPAVARAAVTTADRFTGPAFDRWGGDSGAVYGDSATALLLTRPSGPAPLQLLATATVGVPELEVLHRGADPFGTAPLSVTSMVDSRRTMRQFFASGGGPRFDALAAGALRTVLADALTEAGLAGDDPHLRFVALPRLGRGVLDDDYRAIVTAHTGATILDLGRDTGHLGAGDAAANLADLHATGTLTSGDVAVLLSVGAGFTWSAMIVQAT